MTFVGYPGSSLEGAGAWGDAEPGSGGCRDAVGHGHRIDLQAESLFPLDDDAVWCDLAHDAAVAGNEAGIHGITLEHDCRAHAHAGPEASGKVASAKGIHGLTLGRAGPAVIPRVREEQSEGRRNPERRRSRSEFNG